MYSAQEAVSPWVWIYFVLLVIFGSFFVVNLALAVLYLQFTKDTPAEAPTAAAAAGGGGRSGKEGGAATAAIRSMNGAAGATTGADFGTRSGGGRVTWDVTGGSTRSSWDDEQKLGIGNDDDGSFSGNGPVPLPEAGSTGAAAGADARVLVQRFAPSSANPKPSGDGVLWRA